MTEDEDVYNIGSVVLTIEYNPKSLIRLMFKLILLNHSKGP